MLGRDQGQSGGDGRQRVAAVHRHAHELVEDHAALAGRRVAVGERRDPARGVRRRRRPSRENQIAAGVVRISDPLPAACPERAKCSAAATSQGRPEPRTTRVWLPTSGGPAASQVRNRSNRSASSRPAAVQARGSHQQRHLGVVGELAGRPAHRPAATHLRLRAPGGGGEAGRELAGRPELERRPEGIADRGADECPGDRW